MNDKTSTEGMTPREAMVPKGRLLYMCPSLGRWQPCTEGHPKARQFLILDGDSHE